jgi:hypothetical protein
MKAKFYIIIISAVLFPRFQAKAQIDDPGNYQNNDSRVVVNNYYDYDFYYSSRINRFHRSFSAFNFYAPLFTDSYWYNYEPYSWGLSIYGGSGFGFSNNYPVYYDSGWNYPFFGLSYSWGYVPYYYRSWWHHNYSGWYRSNRWDYNFRPVYNTYNNFNSNYDHPRRNGSVSATMQNVSRRVDSNYSRTDVNRVDRDKSNTVINNGEKRRSANSSNYRNPVNNDLSRNNNNVSRGNNNNTNTGNSNNINRSGRNNFNNNPDRNQSNVTHRKVQSVRSESTSTPARRSEVFSGNSVSGRSVRTSTGSSSSTGRSGLFSKLKRSASRTGKNTSSSRGREKKK